MRISGFNRDLRGDQNQTVGNLQRGDITRTVVEHELTPHRMSAEGLVPWTICRRGDEVGVAVITLVWWIQRLFALVHSAIQPCRRVGVAVMPPATSMICRVQTPRGMRER